MRKLWPSLRNLVQRRRGRPRQTPLPSRDGPDLLLGAAVLQLLVDRGWVDGRAEKVELLDATTQERTVSIEFHVPLEVPGSAGGIGAIPLTALRKPGNPVDVRTETDTPVATLPRAQTEFVSWSVLGAAAETAATRSGHKPDQSLLRALKRVVTSAPEDARAILDELLSGTDPVRTALGTSELFRTVAVTLADGLLLLVGADEVSRGRNLLRMKYRDTIESTPGGYGRWPGWSPVPFVFPIPGASDGRSYELEVSAPPDLRIIEASMWGDSPQGWNPVVRSPDRRTAARLRVDEESNDPPTHAWVWVGATRKGMLRRCLASTGTHVLLLIGGLWHLARGEPPPDLSVAAMALAGVTSLFAADEPQDLLAARLLAGPRRCAALSGILSLAAAASVVLAAPDGPVRSLWGALFLAALFSFSAVAVAYRRARPNAAWGRRDGRRAEAAGSLTGSARPPSTTGFFVGDSAEVRLPGRIRASVVTSSSGLQRAYE